MHYKHGIGVVLTFVAMIIAPAAQAHGVAADGTGLLAGLSHPILGLDHLLAMLAVGLWAARQGGRALWQLPLAFACMMIAGAGLALTGLALPAVEAGIATSVVVFGLLLAAAARVAPSVGLALVGIFAVFHGYAHVMEMPQTVPAWSYGAGLVMVTSVLQLAGIALGSGLRGASGERLVRWGGAAIASGGLLLWA